MEVLVVLAIIGLTGILALSPGMLRDGTGRAEQAGPMHAVVDSARHLAVLRQHPVRLRVDTGGLWSVLAPDVTAPIAAGRITGLPVAVDITVDARGICKPATGRVPHEAPRTVFDAGTCRWVHATVAELPAGRAR